MGRLIPAGTGLPQYKHLDIQVDSPTDEVQGMEDALAASHTPDAALQASSAPAPRPESGVA
jgi:DNA-directed RNA polymerase subunit beta'